MTKKIPCKVCGFKFTDQPECVNCKWPVTGVEFHNDHAHPDDDVSKLSQVSWGCKNCGHTGVKWTRKAFTCPNCNHSVRLNILGSIGNCNSDSVWPERPTGPSLKNPLSGMKSVVCSLCHGKLYYRETSMPDLVCPNCGGEWEE